MTRVCLVGTPYPDQLDLPFQGLPLKVWLENQVKKAGISKVAFLTLPAQTSMANLLSEASGGFLWMAGPLPAASPQALAYFMASSPQEALVKMPWCQGHWAPLVWLGPQALARWKPAQKTLASFMATLPIQEVEVWDPGLFRALSKPQDLSDLSVLVRDREVYGPSFVESIRNFVGLPPHIRAHCDAVALVATRLALALQEKGHPIDVHLTRAGAQLHDLCRLMPRHEEAGADLLRRMGYPDLAAIVAKHMEVQEEDIRALNEAALVFYADKITEETCRVTPYQRYYRALDHFPPSTLIGDHILYNLQSAWAVERALKDVIGLDFEKALSLAP